MSTPAKYPAALLALVDVGGELPGFPTVLLSGAHNNSTTTITLTATVPAYWPTAGWVTIDSEIIQYAGKSGATLTSCTRGAQSAYGGSVAASHADQATVGFYLTPQVVNQIVADLIAIETQLGINLANVLTSTLTVLLKGAKSSNIASATTTDLSTATGNEVHVTGTTTITGFGTVTAGTVFRVIFDGALKVTYNASSLILDGATDFYSQAGDHMDLVSEGSGNWKEVGRGYGTAAARYVNNKLSGDVTMTNATTFYDGPSISVGAGVWLVTGGTTLRSGGSGSYYVGKLWDGSTGYTSHEIAGVGNNVETTSAFPPTIVTLTATTTLKISYYAGTSGWTIKAATSDQGSGNQASQITAVRLF